MKILVTGARAPIAADLARALFLSGHEVHVTDSARFPIGRFSPFIAAYHRLPAPALHFSDFGEAISSLTDRLGIDRIIPTSEEIFWLAQIPALNDLLLAPTLPQLTRLHDKGAFAQLCTRIGHGAPQSVVLRSQAEASAFLSMHDPAHFVLKPCFSRFGNKVRISPTREEVLGLDFCTPWLAQTRIYGRELCVYAIANQGRLCLLEIYEPVYRAGRGASVYFRPAFDARIASFVTGVLAQIPCSGQLSFDLMLTDERIVALECNPRGVSGLHLAAQDPLGLTDALLDGRPAITQPRRPAMLAAALLLYQGGTLFTKAGQADFRAARDVMKAAGVPLHGVTLASAELLFSAWAARQSPLDFSTRDIEWNGPQ